ncbi:MAG: AAA family ATPase [Firmicutes bacterium]|nr:AAA family ATPase [Dethiobacter sp.]MBS3889624.1 AAA family ATPase [Bacillota bacterium]
MGMVLFKRLILRGLGLYGGEAVFDFSPGSNILLGANESGKSTMAEGLCGVLFGLKAPALQYRHWGGSSSFEGELWLSCQGVELCIRRSFATNTIEVRRVDPAGKWHHSATGVHKPEAHKPNKAYLDFLRETFGVTSSEAFRSTYYVAQPLPLGQALDAKVQELISGGGTHHLAAREFLQDSLKNVTRNWRAYAPSLGSGTKERALEKVQDERRELELRLAEQRGATEELRQVESKLDALLGELRAKKANILAQAGIQVAWQQWSVMRDKYVASRDKAQKIDADSTSASNLSQAIEKSTLELAARELPRLRELQSEKAAAQTRHAALRLMALLGEHAVEHVHAVRRFVTELSAQLEEREQDLAQALESERQVALSEALLLNWANDYEKKYGLAPRALSLQDFDNFSTRQSLLEKKSRQEARLREALSRPRRTAWPAVAGLLAGALAVMAIGGQMGVGAGVLLLALGLAVSLFWRGKNPATRILQGELRETEGSLASYDLSSAFLDVGSSELLVAARQDFLLYKEREGTVREGQRVAAERVRYMKGRSTELRQKIDALLSSGSSDGVRGLPRYFAEVSALSSCSLEGRRLSDALADLRKASWDDFERQAKEYVGLSKQLMQIDVDLALAEKEAQQDISTRQGQLAYLLANYNAVDIAALARRKIDATTDMLLARQEWLAHVDKYPGLPSPEQADDVLGVDQAKKALERQLELARAQVESLEQEIFSLRNRQGYLVGQSTESLALGEEALAEVLERERQHTREARVLGIAITELKSAAEEFHTAARGHMEDRTTHYFAAITGTGRHVRLDEGFHVFVVAERGNKVTPAELSQGTRDQLYLALRLAMADLVSAESTIPLLFDDPFLNTDRERLAKMRQAVLSLGRQSILLSHSDIFCDWGQPVTVTRQER